MRRQVNVRCSVNKTYIHPTAIVSEKSSLAEGVQIGPYTIVGDSVRIGKNTKIGSHVVIEGETIIGESNRIHAGCVLGAEPQIENFSVEHSALRIGNYNVIREHVTIHRSGKEGCETVVGDHNQLMIQVHIAHDCRIADRVTIANCVALAGHVQVGRSAVFGGMCGVHQFVRIGDYAMVGAMSRLEYDIPPYCIAEGKPPRVAGVNVIGLKRADFSDETIQNIKRAFRTLYFSKKLAKDAFADLEASASPSKEIQYLVQFYRESKRGVATRK